MVLIMESHTEEFIMKEKVVQSFFQPPMTNNATVATRQLIMGQVLDRTAFVEASCLSGGGGAWIVQYREGRRKGASLLILIQSCT